jgi:hypothetical protein
MSNHGYPQVLFGSDFDERAEFEMPLKGHARVLIETAPGVRYDVFFMDPVRLKQELEMLGKLGEPCLAESGLVVIPEVTVKAIQQAAPFLVEKKFFAALKPE